MNQQRRKLALWSPHNSSQFIVGANDLRLYAIDEEKMAIRVLNINSEVQLFKVNLITSVMLPDPY